MSKKILDEQKQEKIEKAIRAKAKNLVHQTMILLKEEVPGVVKVTNIIE